MPEGTNPRASSPTTSPRFGSQRSGSQGLAHCQAFRSFQAFRSLLGPLRAPSVCRPKTSNECRIPESDTSESSSDEKRGSPQTIDPRRAMNQDSSRSSHRTTQISQIGLANCCAGKKFRSTVDLGSFPFRYKCAGAERRGKNSEASDVPLRSRVRSPSSAGRHRAGIVPGEAEVGDHRIALTSGMRESRGLKRS